MFCKSLLTDDQQSISEFQKIINQAIGWELAFPRISECSDQPKGDPRLPRKVSLNWAQILAANIDTLDTYCNWLEVLQNRIRPELNHALELLRKHPDRNQFNDWAGTYRMVRKLNFKIISKLMSELFSTYSKFLLFKHNSEAIKMKAVCIFLCLIVHFC